MSTRRQFIGGAICVAASVSASAALALSLLDNARGPRLPIGRVVFDGRFAAARSFGDEAERRGFATSSIEGRIQELWYRDLFYRWRDEKLPTAGMTDARTLFLLEMMAKDAGMRVVHRIHHLDIDGASTHQVFGLLARRAELSAKMADGRNPWSARAADIVLQWPNSARSTAASESDIQKARLQALDTQALVSWILC